MIVKLSPSGRSFKFLASYLTHDPDKAQTAERVAWTHTLNLAHDDALSATHEMFNTYQDAELLKEEAGIRRGGAKLEKPVKHVSLNWHPSEQPTREEMIAAAQSFLKHMGWEDHQALLVAHTDKEHAHVHVMVNAVHPERGTRLDDGFEKRRAQAWALEYEREHGKIFCEERLKPAAEREQSEPRPAWQAIKEHSERAARAERESAPFDPSYLGREESRRLIDRREWQILKDVQRDERLAFFANGKQIYRDINRSIYREVREEFRSEWASYYVSRREGLDPTTLGDIKAGLLARQSELIAERFQAAAADKRAERDLEYRALLDGQKEQRAELINSQELGLRSPHLLDRLYPKPGEGIATPADRPASYPEALDRFGIRRGRGMPTAGEGVASEQRPTEPSSAQTARNERSRRHAAATRAGSSFDASHMGRAGNHRIIEHRERQILQELQRDERRAFFAEGKKMFRDLYRSIDNDLREHFRDDWTRYYAAKRKGLDEDTAHKQWIDLIGRQNDFRDSRCEMLEFRRLERDLEYRALLDEQRIERGELTDRQKRGLRSPHLLDRLYPQPGEKAPAENVPPAAEEKAPDRTPVGDWPVLGNPGGLVDKAPKRDAASGLAGGVLGLLGHLGDSLMGGHSKPKAPPKEEALDRFGVQRGQPPPGDALERGSHERRDAHEDRREWREWHHYAERER